MNRHERLEALRARMREGGLDALIIPSADPHQSEYLPDYWSGRIWLTGFDGSAGTALVTAHHAGLWTDVRYFLQAEKQLSGGPFVLYKLMVQTQAEYLDWCIANLAPGQTVACDFLCLSFGQLTAFDEKLKAAGLKLKDCGDLLSDIWPDRPALPSNPVYEHDVKYAGLDRRQKIDLIRAEMNRLKADHFLVSALDEVAWLLNLRGSDVHCNPVFLAYSLISPDQTSLFIHPGKISVALSQSLESDGIRIRPYEEAGAAVAGLSDGMVLIDPNSTNTRIALSIPNGRMISSPSPVMLAKAVKNPTEAGHIRKAMEKDAVALVKAFIWLEKQLQSGSGPSEHDVALKIREFRSQQAAYVGESFDAIIGYGPNGAIIHYRPDPKLSATIMPEGVLLLDSGGQYLDGTTDITRTIALSDVSEEIKRTYTAVLMGHIALSRAVFPKGTRGIQLDAFARQYLWHRKLNYGHGTGHGVGFFMNVHEPPQGFVSAWNQRGNSELVAGMLTSNEPGFYKTGSFGIRIENLVMTRVAGSGEYGDFLDFETMTLFPIDTTLIHEPDMDRASVEWLNEYHTEVYRRVSPYLNEEERAWLEIRCKPI